MEAPNNQSHLPRPLDHATPAERKELKAPVSSTKNAEEISLVTSSMVTMRSRKQPGTHSCREPS